MSKLLLEKAKEMFFYAFLFSVPIFCVANVMDTRVLQERYFQAACMLIGSLFFGNVWITLFVWLNIVLFVFHGGTVGGSQVLSVFLTGVLFACSRGFFQSRSFASYARALYLVAFLSLVIMVCQFFGVDPINVDLDAYRKPSMTTTVNEMYGLFFLPAFNGIFLTIVASLLTMLVSPLGLLLILPILMTKCSAAVTAFGFIIVFWSYHRFRRLLIPITLIGLLASGAYITLDKKNDNLTFMSRFENWHAMVRKTLEYPLGYGPDSFRNMHKNKNFEFRSDVDYTPMIMEKRDDKEVYHFYSANPGKKMERFAGRKLTVTPSKWDTAHNEYIQFVFEYGIFGIILLFFFLREVYDRFILADKTPEVLALFACLCVFAIVSTTQFPFHLARLSGIFGIILGAFWAKSDKWYQLKEQYNG